MMKAGCPDDKCMHGRDTSQTREQCWWSRPLTSALNAAKAVASACAAIMTPRKRRTDIMSHPIQCKTWCTEHRRTRRCQTALGALVIKGRRYGGSNTTSMDRHIKQAHAGTYIRLLDDSQYGFRRHNRHRASSRSRRSGLYRVVLEYTHCTGATLLARYPMPTDEAASQPDCTETPDAHDCGPEREHDDMCPRPPPPGTPAVPDTGMHAPMCKGPAAYSRGGGGNSSSRQCGAGQSVGTPPQHTALQRMTQRMLHQIDRLAGRPQHLWFDPNTDQIQ
jgi:hypothetical protein